MTNRYPAGEFLWTIYLPYSHTIRGKPFALCKNNINLKFAQSFPTEITMTLLSPAQLEIKLPDQRTLLQQSEHEGHSSISSEISIHMFSKTEIDDVNNRSSTSGWNPEDSDYSLNVLLRSSESPCLGDSVSRESLMGSDYSLNVKIPTPSTENKESQEVPSQTAPKSADKSTSSDTERTTKVSFFPRVRIQRVKNRADLSDRHKARVWYTRDEFTAIRQDCFDTLDIMSDNEDFLDEENQLCSRGLEYKTRRAYKVRQRSKLEIRKVVLEEQQFQQETGMSDPDWIARLSRDHSRGCVRGALLAAKKDENDALEYYRR